MTRSQELTMVAVLALAAGTARAQVTVRVDRLDGTGPGAPPANRVVVEVTVDVAETDVWNAAGLRATTANGAVLVYGPGNALVNPGVEDPAHLDRFVTCLSKPLPLDSDIRFFNAGTGVVARFDPFEPTPVATATEINVAWLSLPPPTAGSTSADGAIARVVIDVSQVAGIDPATIAVGIGAPPSGSVPLLVSVPITMNFGLSMNTRARPALVGTDWNVHALPVAPDSRFRRGDANDDGGVNIADALRILSFLFTGATPPACEDAADGNDDGGLDISDALAILGFLFLGSEAPPVPGPTTCGSDLTPDALGRCTDPAGSCD